MPPLSSAAILCASMRSFLALPPWIARMYSACPSTKAMRSWAHRSASQYQVKHTFHRHHQVLAEGVDRGQKRLWCAGDVTRQEHGAGRVHDAQVHLPCVQVDATVMLVGLGIESHLRPPFHS